MSVVALPVQTQNFSLSGAGCSIGDTTLNLKSFKDILGVNLTMASFGSIGYGTIEPGNGQQEEQISFSGVTQNADGSAVLTGVKHVLFKSPFTETSGVAVTHPGSTVFIISNTSGFENAIYDYIDSAVSSGGVPATESQQGITLLSVAPATAGIPIAVGDNDSRVLASGATLYINSILKSGIPFASATGSSTSYTVTLASSIATLATGQAINFKIPVSNATGVTLNINSIGAKPIKKNYDVALASGDLLAGQIASAIYDGTNFQLVNPVNNTMTMIASGFSSKDMSDASTTQNIAHGLGVTPRFVRITAYYSNLSSATSLSITSQAITVYSNGVQSSIAVYHQSSSGATGNYSIHTNNFDIYTISSVGRRQTGVVTVDSTNINIAWTKSDSPTGTAYLIWEALA